MAWLETEDTGHEYGIIEYLNSYTPVDEHFVVEINPETLQRISYFHVVTTKNLLRSLTLVKTHYPDIKFFQSRGPKLEGKWLLIKSEEDYPEILKLILGVIEKEYYVKYDVIKSYGVIFVQEYNEIYIQFREEISYPTIAQFLKNIYDIKSDIVTFGMTI